MTPTASGYPQPQEDPINRPFLEGWRAGRLTLQRCADCGLTFFYPRPMCPGCWSAKLGWIEAQGNGEIVSFTRVYRPIHAAFSDEVAVVLAEVNLPEGATLLARVICDDPPSVRSKMKVTLIGLPEAARYPLPTFRLDPEAARAT